MKFSMFAAAAALALAPMAASAVTTAQGSASYDDTSTFYSPLALYSLTQNGTSFVGSVNSVGADEAFQGELSLGPIAHANSSGSILFKFTSIYATGLKLSNVSTDNPEIFTDLTISWLEDSSGTPGTVIDFTTGSPVAGEYIFADLAAGESVYLEASWSGYTPPANLDFLVTSTPLPAGFLMIGTAMVGAGLISRRRKAAA